MVDEIMNCLRCGHNWQSRVESPARCPACKSSYWGKPRKRVTGLGSTFGRPGARVQPLRASQPEASGEPARVLVPFEE